MTIIAKTGTKAPASGIYRGSGTRSEVALSKGDRVPPNNQGSRQQFVLVQKTKHSR